MTDFSDFKTQITEWINRQDFGDALITSFVRMADQKLNQEMRVSRMIKTAINTITCRCSEIPDDWLEFDLVLIESACAPGGWMPIRYKPRDEFLKLPDTWAVGYYTIEGRTLFFGGTPDSTEGTQFQIYYFAEVPVFADDTESWVYTKYPSLYLNAALMHAYLHAVGEEQQAANAKQLTEDTITKLNNEYLLSKASGSRVSRSRMRSFG